MQKIMNENGREVEKRLCQVSKDETAFDPTTACCSNLADNWGGWCVPHVETPLFLIAIETNFQFMNS